MLQLRHYYKPRLQRYVVRIVIMCVTALTSRPLLYATASAISLFSLQLAEMIDLVRDLYEVRERADLGVRDLQPFSSAGGIPFW